MDGAEADDIGGAIEDQSGRRKTSRDQGCKPMDGAPGPIAPGSQEGKLMDGAETDDTQ